MQAAIEYLTLRKAYPKIPEQVPVRVSMEELSQILYCTPRNVKLILAKLSTNKWIEFIPGRGRGNLSTLTFCVPGEEILFMEATRLIQKGTLDKAMELIRQYGEGSSTKNRLISWLSGYFGYSVEHNSQHKSEILRFPIHRKMNTLDPAYAYYAFDVHIVTQVFDTLVQYNQSSGRILPHLAHHWESNVDCSRWVLYLRKGIQFHNGHDLTAYDVISSLHRLQTSDEHNSQAWLLRDVESLEALDSHTVAIRLRRPNHLFLQILSFPPTSIVALEACESTALAPFPIGTGPFRVERQTDDFCILEAFRHYFKGRPYLDRIEIFNVAVQSEDLGFLMEPHVVVNTGESPKQQVPSWIETEDFYPGSKLLTLNQVKSGPLQDERLREAIHRFLNRKQLVEDLGGNRLYPSNGFQLKRPPSYEDKEFDEEKARKLLRRSDYKGDTLTLYVYERHVPDAYWIQKQFGKNGIQLEVKIVEWRDLLLPETIKEADMILYEANLSRPQLPLLEALQSPFSFIRNHMGPELASVVDVKVSQVLSESTNEKRERILDSIEQILKHNFALSFLVHMKLETSFHPSLRGVQITTNGWVDFKDLWYQPNEAVRFLTST